MHGRSVQSVEESVAVLEQLAGLALLVAAGVEDPEAGEGEQIEHREHVGQPVAAMTEIALGRCLAR